MHRQLLLRQLAVYEPYDPDEAVARRRIMEFVLANPECFSRELAIGHVTGSAWIVDPARQSALLVHHAKLDRWLQPGGHADGEGNIRNVALREAREETGLADLAMGEEAIFDLDIHAIPARDGFPEHLHYDVRYLFQADPLAPLTASAESHAVEWRPLTEIAEQSEESLARMARKTLPKGWNRPR